MQYQNALYGMPQDIMRQLRIRQTSTKEKTEDTQLRRDHIRHHWTLFLVDCDSSFYTKLVAVSIPNNAARRTSQED
jgi:hypothetical protein